MATAQQAPHDLRGASGPSPTRRDLAAFGSRAAAFILVTVGIIEVLEGISAIFADRIIVVGPQYTYQWTTSGWGVVHIVIGGLIVFAGVSLMTGQAWARMAAIALASLSIIANFLWLPFNPWWSVLIIALDAFVIWAVATWHTSTE